MSKSAFNASASPDYFITQIPPGGQRGYASVLLLDYFEKQTGIPSHFLFPNITASSVGILIASALYLPHPEDKNAARMTANQLSDIFPAITARLPKRPAYLHRKNDREPLEKAIYPYIGESRLSDFMGTVFFSTHTIGNVGHSYKIYAKKIHPSTGDVTYHDDKDTRVMDIALAGTAIPSVFPSHRNQIDLAFAEVPAPALIEMQKQYDRHLQGGFIRLGNFRSKIRGNNTTLIESGAVMQTLRAAINHAISDNSYSQTLQTANAIFGKEYVFNLEQEINTANKNAPKVSAITTTPEQFLKIKENIDQFIKSNKSLLECIAEHAAEIARKTYPDKNLSIVEYALPAIPDDIPKKKSILGARFKRAPETAQPL